MLVTRPLSCAAIKHLGGDEDVVTRQICVCNDALGYRASNPCFIAVHRGGVYMPIAATECMRDSAHFFAIDGLENAQAKTRDRVAVVEFEMRVHA